LLKGIMDAMSCWWWWRWWCWWLWWLWCGCSYRIIFSKNLQWTSTMKSTAERTKEVSSLRSS